MENMIAANLRSRPTRTLISIFAVSLGVILMLIIGGITTGTLNDYLGRTMGVGADFILQPSGSTVFYAFSSAALPVKLAEKLREVAGVSAAAPVLSKFSSADFGLIFGVDLESYNLLPGRLHILQGQASLSGREVIVDELFAKSHNLKPGMPLTVLGNEFTVSGICRSGAVVRMFVSLRTLQELNATPDKATIIFVKASPGADVEEVYSALRSRYPELTLIRASDPQMLLADTRMPGLQEFRITVVVISMLISFMVILLAMYTTIFERTREIGILKSLGASRGFIVAIILKESVMISGLGVVLGTLASALVKEAITQTFPTLQISMTMAEIIRGCVLGVAGGTLGALYPAYKAARMDPVKALSFE